MVQSTSNVMISWAIPHDNMHLNVLCKLFMDSWSLFVVDQNHFIDDRYMKITFKHEFECDWLILSTVTCPIMKGCVHLYHQIIVY